ncbi:MAG: DEAD/DEAH box helicase [Pseudomonadota bacterium]|nr:DEAD/DEAH box helicase [Pseudomonadota bacterium]
MLPATLAQEVKKQVQHYLGATFHMRLPQSERALEAFFNHPEDGLFKGPWVQLKRPFRLAENDGAQFFDLAVPFMPFRHQWQSWQRLTTKGGNQPKHTLVTTGTGSGKTECFLYPLLDHCLRERQAGRRDGIKAIVLYPMNALAADQGKRFAEEVLNSDKLSELVNGPRRARVRVGLYTGRMSPNSGKEEGAEPGTYTEMEILLPQDGSGKRSYTPITNRASMQNDPPDILLTNYKMLDYLLLRPKDQNIWRFNQQDPTLLRYLVLDELHTYDGAQGADVACLLRRLKARLNLPQHQLCVVGTSATIAGGDDETTMDPVDRLCDFATSLFEEPITNDCVLTEDRYKVAEIAREGDLEPQYPPAQELEPRLKESAGDYARRVAGLFGAPEFPVELSNHWLATLLETERDAIEQLAPDNLWGLALAEWLRVHPLFESLLLLTEDKVLSWNELVAQLSKKQFAFAQVGTLFDRSQMLMAFLALVSQARELRSGRAFPLVPTQVQFWLRELRRVGLLVNQEPQFCWLDEPIPNKKQLPAAHCTECGEIAWAALHNPDMDAIIQQRCQGFELNDDVKSIYQGWGFEGHTSPRIVILSPWREGDDPVTESGQQQLEGMRWHLAPNSLVVRQGPGPCPLTEEPTFPVKVSRESRTQQSNNQRVGVIQCPHCHAEDTMMFIGSRAATIASVAIDEVFGSVLNNDPKLLAFTDSVQDASHRAGFFSARTYNFTLRTALQHVIDEAGEAGLPLPEVGEHLLAYWSQPLPGRPGSVRKVMETLIPPDLREYSEYIAFRDNSASAEPPAKLRNEFVQRLNWQVTSEFSLMLTHGRTMELHASAVLAWDEQKVQATMKALRQRFPGISPALESLDDESLRVWLYGILHRQRERGGLYHPYLDKLAEQNLWGKFSWRNQSDRYRETYPPRGRYIPKLWVTANEQRHDFLLASSRSGAQQPWQIAWARRVLGLPGVDEATLLDLLHSLMRSGVEAGLLRCVHRDGDKEWYAISDQAALLMPRGHKFQCQQSNHVVFRPEQEATLWQGSPSLSYRAEYSTYQPAMLNDRERYYQERYRKGALRRVFAYEHTGLLTTEERENLELSFNSGGHADDPNVLTATSTLEMGIDIGDLSTTMLCSVPPTTASYLQRIGRAGRKTGTALVLSVINQRPHDLFFYARPDELLSGDVEPPGCWLDASAVLVRQYLAFCFDQAVSAGMLTDLPATGKQLIDEVLVNKAGHIPGLLEWMLQQEVQLQTNFLSRFERDIRDDTRERFVSESRVELLQQRIATAAQEFQLQRQMIQNARNRLKDQRQKLDSTSEENDLAEIEREEKILDSRQRKLSEITALEVLTEHGLLPNYAFPERGIRFSGSTFKKHQNQNAERPKSIELVRAASSGIRELAPANHFYTHSHKFEVQQIEIGSKSQSLLEQWAICGQCGHMRPAGEVRRPDARPDCPQCHWDGPTGQDDSGQHKALLPFQRSQAISYMEYYESLSGDSAEERENEFYTLFSSFDPGHEKPEGAVGEDETPFGIEYRASMRMYEVNAGYSDLPTDLDVGQDKRVSSVGFEVCQDCGVAVMNGQRRSGVRHRRSCSGHRETMKRQREGRNEDAYRWQPLYLYRELRSEAIRLLLPDVDQADLDTLEAAIYLGMRIRFQGDPAHLLIKQQIVPDHSQGITRNYLVLLDAVPGGTGFLKALFQDDDEGQALPAEGIIQVLQLALNALETCSCRQLHQTRDDPRGCYRCIRTYHMQHKAENIDRERGIELLRILLDAGRKRTVKEALADVKVHSLFGSVLEKRFIDRLRDWIGSIGANASWKEAIIAGTQGFEFSVGDGRLWSIELQPMLGAQQDVSVQCQPDFLIRCDDPDIKPIVVFTDGFEPHVKPGEDHSVLPDDMRKRRAVMDSERYLVWSITWDDLDTDSEKTQLSFLQPHLAKSVLPPHISKLAAEGIKVPELARYLGNPYEQLTAYLTAPNYDAWRKIAHHIGGFALMMLAGTGRGQDAHSVNNNFELWRQGYSLPPIQGEETGDWVHTAKIALNEDFLAYGYSQELLINDFTNLRIALRLGDYPEERKARDNFRTRWRQFLAMMNVFQFSENFMPFVTSEVDSGYAPELRVAVDTAISHEWYDVIEEAISSLSKLCKSLAGLGASVPQVEFYNDDLGEDICAELAWPDKSTPIAILMGDQAAFASKWMEVGWIAITQQEMASKGEAWVVSMIVDKEI